MTKAHSLLAGFWAIVSATAFAADAPHDAKAAGDAPVRCAPPYAVGYRVVQFGSLTSAVWYPTRTVPRAYAYASGLAGSVAPAAEPLTTCGRFPLVVFSHGLAGCAIQSVFFTESLARRGYVVVAPEHRDAALCSVTGRAPRASSPVQPPSVLAPADWGPASYEDRRADVAVALDAMLNQEPWSAIVAADRIGIAGHSLGGYVALGMVGGWREWHDPRLRAALLFSPYSLPLSLRSRLRDIRVPLMYQGADLDLGVTTFLDGPQGAYAQSNAPKAYVKLRGGNHFTWTNLQCAGTRDIAACLATRPEARLINAYGIAFFDEMLGRAPQRLLREANPALSFYGFAP